MTPDLTETTCLSCGKIFHYEPVILFGRDLARSLHRNCDACVSALKEREQKEKLKQRITELLGQVDAVLPPDLVQTSRLHPAFNLPLWELADKWKPHQENNSLGIIGPAARCKTRVMALLAKQMMVKEETRVTWTSAVRLKDAATDRYSRDRQISTIAREHLEECRKTPWLFLDDLGKNEWSPAFESQLFQILDHRMNHQLPTVWSANAHPEDFAPYLSPLNAWPIIGRLLDRCTLLDLREE